MIITKINKFEITNHKLYTYGVDGCIWSKDTKQSAATLLINVKVEDYSDK